MLVRRLLPARRSDDGIMPVRFRTGDVPVEFQPMSPEDMQRTMQFLLAQQAKFAADFEKLTIKTDRMTDAIIGLTGIVGRLADHQERTEGIVGRLADQQEYVIGVVTRIADQQNRTDEQIRETNALVAHVADQQNRTDEQIRETNALVAHVADQQNRTDEQIRETNTQLGETNAQVRETNTRVDDLGQYIKTVEAHLNAVIEMFERHLREDHGQRPS
jgi:chromosome segregation ATPase